MAMPGEGKERRGGGSEEERGGEGVLKGCVRGFERVSERR